MGRAVSVANAVFDDEANRRCFCLSFTPMDSVLTAYPKIGLSR